MESSISLEPEPVEDWGIGDDCFNEFEVPNPQPDD